MPILLSEGSSSLTMIIILVAMIALMYFMMIRPQNKEKKRVNEMLAAMEIGDAVLTSSGFYGVVIEITDQDVIVEFGNNKNCRIPMRKAAIIQVEKPYGAAAATAVKTDKKPKKAEAVQDKAEEAAAKVEETAEQAEKAAAQVEETAAEAEKKEEA